MRWHQKGRTVLDFNEARYDWMGGDGISWTICSLLQTDNLTSITWLLNFYRRHTLLMPIQLDSPEVANQMEMVSDCQHAELVIIVMCTVRTEVRNQLRVKTINFEAMKAKLAAVENELLTRVTFHCLPYIATITIMRMNVLLLLQLFL